MKTETYPGYNQWASAPNLAYVLADGAFLCPDCANRKNGSIASVDANTDDQWRIIGSQFVEATANESCGHCNKPLAHFSCGGLFGPGIQSNQVTR